ncbi:glycosyltransferase [Neobacillus sp. 179-J 1A1 HS]|uniref:CgeB family protein n=1 Tax=Neobacillus driksii TaxID=3035913 RepID=UPI0035BC1944
MSNGISNKLEQINRTRKWLNQGYNPQFERKSVEEIGSTGWYKQIDAPVTFDHLTSAFYSKLESNQHAYFSFREQNTKFSLSPSEKPLNLQPNQEYQVTFKGSKDDSIAITIIAIFYKDGNRIEDQNIPFNKETSITVSKDFDNIRIALKVMGNGKFAIDNIQIGDISLWETTKKDKSKFLRLSGSNWYAPNTKEITFESVHSSFYINLEKGSHLYIPYREANINFNNAPQNPIEVKEGERLSVLFEGEKDLLLDVKLFLIFYNKENEKIDIQQIELNSKKLVLPSPDAVNMRIALRVQGTGNFQLNAVGISGVGYWLPNRITTSETSYPKYDYVFNVDKENLFGLYKDNKILVHNEFHCFESLLSAKQYRFLPCIDHGDLNDSPKKSLFTPKPKHYYEIFPTANLFEHVKLELFILCYKNGRRIDIKQVPFNQQSIISFSDDTTDIKAIIRVNGTGVFQNIRINIDEKEIETTNELKIELNKESWFPSNKLITLKNENTGLVVESTAAGDKRAYAAYKEKNNSYATPPVSHLLPINKDAVYEFNLRVLVPEGVQFIPMVVEYAGEKKLEVYQLRLNTENTLRFHPDTTDIRIAFRIGGAGIVTIEEFDLKEMLVYPDTDRTEFLDNREPYELNLVKPKPLKKLKMAVIFDEFTTASYAKECELITFTPDNWLETLTSNKPDLLMVESAWVGNNGSWNKLVGYYGEDNMKPLFSLIKWCNENNIPTVFWNKEDPVHFNRFIKTAIKFDYIFTTDERMVPSYKEQAGHEQVYALPFAAQPAIHNPIKIVEERENKACFAGSYYRHHEERAQDMDRVLDYAAKYGLDIYDRNYEKNLKGLMPNHRFPERLEENIKGSLKYYEIDKAYKGYKVMINVNTVKDSPTMFSRRVFEGLASGTPVVSTYAKGIEVMFGDLVYISENEQEIDKAFKELLTDDEVYREKSMLGIRDVLSKHTYTERLKYICEIAGIPVYYELPKVTVLALIHSKDEFFRVLQQFEYQKYEHKELYLLVDTFDGYLELFQKYNTKSVKTFIRSYMQKYQNILEWIDSPYITYFDKNDFYGSNYLLDLMLATTFTDSDFIGKSAHYKYENKSVKEQNANAEYEFVTSLHPASTVIKTEVFSKESLLDVLSKLENGTEYTSYLKFGKQLYSNDKFNYVANAFDGNQGEQLDNKILKQIEI